MGYDTHIAIGRLGLPFEEAKDDLTKPYEDGSGYECLRDENGDYVLTGITSHSFDPYVEVNLCKIYNSHLSKVHEKYKDSPLMDETNLVYIYQKDGNTRFEEDYYGDKLILAPFEEVFEAVKKDAEKDEYRRFRWLKSAMMSMEDNKSELHCIFYGS
jgi:hypothetical protein